MSVSFTFQKNPKIKADTAVALIYANSRLSEGAKRLDRECGGVIGRCLKKQHKFKGKKDQLLTLAAPEKGDYARLLLVGCGNPAAFARQDCENAGGHACAALNEAGAQKVRFYTGEDAANRKISPERAAAHIAMGIKLRSYNFSKYKSKKGKNGADGGLKTVEFVTPAHSSAAALYAILDKTATGIFLARDLVNEPPNELYPENFARIIRRELHPLGVEVEIFDEKKLRKLGFHALLAVGMGSAQKPHAVIMRWKGNGKKPAGTHGPLAFAGKGVTFDTGGVNLKSSGAVEDMKLDMGGAAVVVGLMKTLALRKSDAHVVGVAGLAENMASHTAYRPGDILKSLSGQTIEVLNTDAEGRLVLADCLTYVQKTYKPCLVIDLATLTGAMMVALGHEYCGTFVNDEQLWKQLEKASGETGENLWRMPLDEIFKKDMESKIADLKNLGSMGRYAGACTAAGFLEHFIEDKRPWAHLDIAGTAWIKKDKPTCPKPGTGFGVRVLDRFIADNYE